MDFDGAYRRDGSAVVDPDPYDSSLDLLLGLYAASLITTPYQTRWNYNYLSNSYCPPSVWAAWSPLQRSLWIESALEYELRDYEYRLRRINDDLIRDLKREMERAKEED